MLSLCHPVSPCNRQHSLYTHTIFPLFLGENNSVFWFFSCCFSWFHADPCLSHLIESTGLTFPETAMKHRCLTSSCMEPRQHHHCEDPRCPITAQCSAGRGSRACLCHTNIRCLKPYIEGAGLLLVTHYGMCILSAPALVWQQRRGQSVSQLGQIFGENTGKEERKLWLACESAYCYLSASAKPRPCISLVCNQVNAPLEDNSPFLADLFFCRPLDLFLRIFVCWVYTCCLFVLVL